MKMRIHPWGCEGGEELLSTTASKSTYSIDELASKKNRGGVSTSTLDCRVTHAWGWLQLVVPRSAE